MTLRPEFAGLPADFHDFLFAPIGREESGSEMTVYSALARVGVDPWGETARLSAMPRDAAAQTLATLMSGITDASWKEAEAPGIAARLVELLPPAGAHKRPPPEVRSQPPAPAADSRSWLLLLIGAAVAAALVLWSLGGQHGFGP